MDIQQHFNTVMQGNAKLKSLTDLKVKTQSNVKELMDLYGAVIQLLYPNGEELYSKWIPIQNSIIPFGSLPTPHDKKIVTLFQRMKQYAEANNMKELSEAVTSSAFWYWKNVEPKTGNSPSSPSSYAINPTDPVVQKIEKRQKRAKYIQWGVITASLLGGGFLLYKAFFSQPAEPVKTRVKRNPKRSGKVDKRRVRSYRRNQKKTPVIVKNKTQRPSSLANYRKRFEAEKKSKSSKKVVRRNSKSKLRLKK